eukprot:scaffold134770_cov22-Prasinocladus_malaysianus.AAC.1
MWDCGWFRGTFGKSAATALVGARELRVVIDVLQSACWKGLRRGLAEDYVRTTRQTTGGRAQE